MFFIKKSIFTPSSEDIWKHFNKIKIETYIRDLKRFKECSYDKKTASILKIDKNFSQLYENKVPADRVYNNVEIRITENRKINV